MSALDTALIAAHAAGDGPALVRLYTQAADAAEPTDIDAACFFLTHAYVFALEQDHPEVATIRARLVAHGREPGAQSSFSPS